MQIFVDTLICINKKQIFSWTFRDLKHQMFRMIQIPWRSHVDRDNFISGQDISRVSCQKGPTRHAYAWQIGPFWQDTLDIYPVLYTHSSIGGNISCAYDAHKLE